MRVGLLVDITKNYKEEIHHAKELGFDNGQICIWDMDFYTEENLKGLKKCLEDEKFEATSMWCGWSGPVNWRYPDMYTTLGLVPDWMRAKRLDDLKKGAKFAYNLGINTVVTHIGYTPDNPFDPAHIAIVHGLKVLCKELSDRGQKFAFETGEEIPLTLSLLIQEIGLDNVGVNFDPANLLSSGRANPNDAMELLGTKIFGMHAKDANPPKYGDRGGKQTVVGKGSVDFKRLLTQLKNFGYEGDIIIEHEIPDATQRDIDIRETKVYLEKLISEIF